MTHDTILTNMTPGHPVELPDEPDTDGDVEEHEDPVAGHEEQRQDDQLKPQWLRQKGPENCCNYQI